MKFIYYDPVLSYDYNHKYLSERNIGFVKQLQKNGHKIYFIHSFEEHTKIKEIKPDYIIVMAEFVKNIINLYNHKYIIIANGLENDYKGHPLQNIFDKSDYIKYKDKIKLILFNGYCIELFDFFDQNNIKYLHFPFVVDTYIFKPLQLEKKYLFIFVGVLHNKNTTLLDELVLHYGKNQFLFLGIDFSRYGIFNTKTTKNFQELNKYYSQSYFGINCFSNLQMGKNQYNSIHFNQRFFDLQATNCMQIVLYNPYMESYFDDQELVKNLNIQEAIEHIEYYRNNETERNKIIKNANNRIKKEWNFEVKIKEMLNIL